MSRGMSPLSDQEAKKSRCLGGTIHLNAGIRIVVSIGSLVILGLVAAFYMKFKKAMFVLLIPTAVTAITVFAIVARRHRFVWPLIAISFFHIVLACYALLIFSFYFFFKPFYIIMVLNWVFDSVTTHLESMPQRNILCDNLTKPKESWQRADQMYLWGF
ncbi:unnamed protein product [Nippostrongylus brasiliensis]|uniref:Transmembrane protein n=1 Tax=Nippostrongylus brasiliensis TaxID=27835 RepID=A0A0N4XYK6_NIPBR|nr:unnamed protein product [Nippostrongylus brasiliensis]